MPGCTSGMQLLHILVHLYNRSVQLYMPITINVVGYICVMCVLNGVRPQYLW